MGFRSVDQATLPKLKLTAIRPHISLLLLEYVGDDIAAEHAALVSRLKRLEKSRSDVTRTVVASGVDELESTLAIAAVSPEDREILHVDGYVTRVRRPPSWQEHGAFQDEVHALTLVVFYGAYVAIVSEGKGSALQSWLDRSPRPPFRRIDRRVLEHAFLSGDAKSLWLKAIHAPRSSRATSKQLGGPSLQDALDPFDDSSFSLSSGRAEIGDSALGAPSGKIGATLADSAIWLRKSEDFGELVSTAIWACQSIMSTASRIGTDDTGVLPWLAVGQRDLSAVKKAFHLSISTPDEVPPEDSDPDLIDALHLLEEAEIVVTGKEGASFLLDVGLGGSIGGTLRIDPSMSRSSVKFAMGWEGEPTDASRARPVLDALRSSAHHLRVHYESGHMLDSKGAWTQNPSIAPFPGWRWHDFTGFDAAKEKPSVEPGESLHALVAAGGDDSLFAWVVRTFSTGYLVCDDGAGEVGDFVHLAHDDVITIVHVKSAKRGTSARGVAVQQYEVVASQAVKNFSHLRGDGLLAALSVASRSRYATWLDGVRLPNRSEFLEMLAVRRVSAGMRVVIVQPQVDEVSYSHPSNASKVRLLDTLLNSARSSASGIGVDFEVWARV